MLEVPVDYLPHYLDPAEASTLLNALDQTLDWQQEYLRMYGKSIPFPRLMAWYGNAGASYTFSRKTYQPQEPTAELQALMHRLNQDFGQGFNSVLANAYRTGADSMAWHSDDEPELGPQPFIASISLGQTRVFKLRHRQTREVHAWDLEHGSLMIMRNECQSDWEHCVPKSKKAQNLRINLTFRQILPAKLP